MRHITLRDGSSGRMIKLVAAAAIALLAGACGGGGDSATGGGPPPPPPPPPPAAVTKVEAYRFLNQASFGATEAEAQRLVGLGDSSNAYSRWIDAEIARPASTLRPYVEAAYTTLSAGTNFNLVQLNAPRVEKWFENALRGPTSCASASRSRCRRSWWSRRSARCRTSVRDRRLLRHAGAQRLRQLPRAARGRDAAPGDGRLPVDARQPARRRGHQPAPGRELRPRGDAAVRDRAGGAEHRWHAAPRRAGQPIPTYDQAVIEGFARVFTGWKWACPTTPELHVQQRAPAACARGGLQPGLPMRLYPEQHETRQQAVAELSGRHAAERPASGRPGRHAGPGGCARQHLQSPERRPVHLPGS
jgi:hypothetical protein